jgi:hypothetical protein
MPKFEECMNIINPQGLPPEVLSDSEKVFLDFCEYWDTYPQKIKEVVKSW